jgi:alcohol dehydrogenase (cytochrome c)
VLCLIFPTQHTALGEKPSHPAQAAAGQPATQNSDWPHFGNTTDQTRYSTLNQITTANVSKLGIAWTIQQGAHQVQWETDPVVVGGVMYLTTNTDQVIALDAATGKELWRYTPNVSFMQLLTGGGGVPVNRGVEVAGGRVFLLTYDAQLIALDAHTGHHIWSSRVADAGVGYNEPSPPTYWNGRLFVGSAEGDSGLRGFVAAYDASSGRQLWRFYTVPAPGHSWMPSQGAHGGGDVWMPTTIDAQTGILYFGTGNPSPDLVNNNRPGCNPWVDATVALDARTGKFLWGRTQVCPDVWDYDSGQTPILLQVRQNGRSIRAVGEGNKSGVYWIFDARTGATLATSPPLAPQSGPRSVPNQKGVYVCPGKFGGLDYSPPAYSPKTGMIYLPGVDLCMVYKQSSAQAIKSHVPGAPDLGGTAEPGKGPARGFMAAIDAGSGRIKWRLPMPKPMIGGTLATAGNLVFSGSDDGHLYAFDAATGKVLWHPDLGLGFGAAPITYQIHGVQYVAIAAGGSGAAPYTGARMGGSLAVFKLGGKPITRLPAGA